MSVPHIFVFGCPDVLGGAVSEQWDTMKLWRQAGWLVTCIAVKGTRRAIHRCHPLGIGLVDCAAPDNLPGLPGLAGGVLVDFCHHPFVRHWAPVARAVCPIVHVACMSGIYPVERAHYLRHGTFAAHVFQSDFQLRTQEAGLQRYGMGSCQVHRIAGALDLSRWPFRPRPDGHVRFVVGRMSRPDVVKFSWDHWELYRQMPAGTQVRIQGWSPQLERRYGTTPPNVATAAAGSTPPGDFLAGLHLYVQSGQVPENWPRVGLEAMAAGVPLVVDDSGGWREMVVHGVTGWRAATAAEFGYFARIMARDQTRRTHIARAARERVEALTRPETLLAKWRRLFGSLGPNPPPVSHLEPA